ncbi:TPA: homocysteine S-methyltransferase family protein [Candidatus Woesearchaeota archaeon]|nr:homocysteine S-methyltransferase family protein [Candidatus Woesearchaeota archaeon]
MAIEPIVNEEAQSLRQHISQNRILSGPYGSVLDDVDLIKFNSGHTNWRLAFGDDSGRKLLEGTAKDYARVLEDGDFLALPTFGLAYSRIKELGDNIIKKLTDPNAEDAAKFRAKLQEIDVPELERLIHDLTGFSDDEINSLVVKFNNDAVRIGKEALQSSQAVGKNLKLVAPIAPYGDCYSGKGFTTIDDAVKRHLEQTNLLKDHVDLFLFETNCTVEQAIAASIAGEKSGKPYIISFVVDKDGYLRGNNGKVTVADAIKKVNRVLYQRKIQQSGLVTYGINCSSEYGTISALTQLAQERKIENVRLVYLNASPDDQCVNEAKAHGHRNQTAEEFAASSGEVKRISEFVTVFSGCCGIKPDYLPVLRDYIKGNSQAVEGSPGTATASVSMHEVKERVGAL